MRTRPDENGPTGPGGSWKTYATTMIGIAASHERQKVRIAVDGMRTARAVVVTVTASTAALRGSESGRAAMTDRVMPARRRAAASIAPTTHKGQGRTLASAHTPAMTEAAMRCQTL